MKNNKSIISIMWFNLCGLWLLGYFNILPTTPFLLLLASVCFVKGSDRFDCWFKSTNFI